MHAVVDLATFLNERWDEDERDSVLFHELDCPGIRHTEYVSPCNCPVPLQICRRIASHRRILQDCQQRIGQEREAGVCWPRDSIFAFQTMKALALPFELHPAWQDSWYP